MNTNSIDYLTFCVGPQWYGLPVYDVIEVIHFVALDELPATSPDVLGLLTLRNLVLPVIDLRIRFGLSSSPELTLNTPIIVLRAGDSAVGIVVDDVDDVVHISDISEYQGKESAYVKHVAKLPDKLLLLLDLDSLKIQRTFGPVMPAI